jgi:HSP20 family protein
MLLHSGTVREPTRLTARVFTGRTPCVRLDAYRDGDTFFVDIDLPRPDRTDVDVSADHDALTVRASRRGAAAQGTDGTVARQVDLSEKLDTDRLDARYDDDVLTVRIPILADDRRLAAAA